MTPGELFIDDGQHVLTCEPAASLPMAQRYFLF